MVTLINILEEEMAIRPLQTVVLAALTAGIGLFAYESLLVSKRKRALKKAGKRARKIRDKSVAALSKKYPMTTERLAIVVMPFEELVAGLQNRTLRAKVVMEAYIAKALEVHAEFNCITVMFHNALEMAENQDETKNIVGPLHGLPFCVKDDTDMRGYDTTHGCAKYLDNPKRRNAPFIEVLIKLGAIPFCKTNVPQTLLSFGSHNPIYGETLNPLNKLLSPGGSSSGSACLVSAGGAVFGTGSDTGGSLRIPAHFTGISTLRSTYRRHSSKGVSEKLLPGCVGVKGVPGILAKSPKTLTTIMKHLINKCPQYGYDANVVPLTWDKYVLDTKPKLRIGYYTSLDMFPAMGDTEGIILAAKAALESHGHTLVPFQLPGKPEEWWDNTSDLIYSDAGTYLEESLEDEEISHSISLLHDILKLPMWVRRVAAFIFKFVPGKMAAYRSKFLSLGSRTQASRNLWESMEKRRHYIDLLDSSWDALKLDLVICPVFPFPAPKLADAPNLISAIMYTMYYNWVDFPAGVVPFGKESGRKFASYDSMNDPLLELGVKSIELSRGMPIGVQVVGKPFQEELILRVMVELEQEQLDLSLAEEEEEQPAPNKAELEQKQMAARLEEMKYLD